MDEPIDLDDLWAAAARGDDRAIIGTFECRSERDRRQVAPQLLHRLKQYTENHTAAGLARFPHCYGDTMCAALFGCLTLSEIKRTWYLEPRWGGFCNEVTLEILVERQPTWLTAWAEWALDRQASPAGRAGGLWRLIRKLIKAGVCEPLNSDGYILGMVFDIGSSQYGWRSRWLGESWYGKDNATGDATIVVVVPPDNAASEAAFASHPDQTVTDLLLADPDLLEREIWRIFEVHGRPSRQLTAPPPDEMNAGHGRTDREWIEAFVTLADRGRIDRQRVLDSALDALAGDRSAYQAAWFIALWHALAPTPTERADRHVRIVRLVAKPIPKIADFATNEGLLLQQAGTLIASDFIVNADGNLLTMPAGTARTTLAILARIIATNPENGPAALTAAANGLYHANPRIRAETTRLLKKHDHAATEIALNP